MGWYLGFQLLCIPQLGATGDPGHSTKIMREGNDGRMVQFVMVLYIVSVNSQFQTNKCLVPQDVMAPEVARGVPLPVYITSKSILQSSTELALIGYIYI